MGRWATVWLAKDHRLERPVAIKILVSKLGEEHQETALHRRISSGSVDLPGRNHVPELFDCFEIQGPNGVHQCLVMELLGPSMASLAESYAANRLPGDIACKVARQVVQAVAYMHRMGVVHGDIHPGNIVLVDESVSKMSAEDVLRSMDSPETAEVRGYAIGKHTPQYLVLPSTLPPSAGLPSNCNVKIVDFGSAFISGEASPKMRYPLPFRAPEAVITGSWDVEADVWSLGCMIFALIVGYPPFDSFLFKEEELAEQWIATFGGLPKEWEGYPMAQSFDPADLETADLPQWLRETYYDDDKFPYFT
ncbi:hypothetical protein Q7P36_004023 [Cladosporium allicinum]